MFARRSYNVAPDIIDAGQGGGGGNITNLSMPIGSVIPFAGSTIPDKWLLCNGSEYNQATAEDLFDVIGYSYGVAPASTQISVGFYTYGGVSPNTISFYQDGQTNTFIKAGTYVKPSGMTANAGVDINGTIILITSAPAIGSSGGGSYIGTFVNPISGTGNGSNDGLRTYLLNRFSVPVPDLRLASPIGAQAGTINLGTSGGSATTTITANNLPSHQHGVFQAGGRSAVAGGGNLSGDPNVDNGTRTVAGATYVDSGGALVQNTPISTRNPYVALNYIIHAKL
jgi:microcystin-dependent protein